jgi:thiamine biosynthesis lipoprotein
MGTTCSLFGEGDLEAGRRWVQRVAALVTRFDASSELSRLNDAGGRWCSVSAELEDMLRASRWAFEVSGGLVNVAVEPAMQAIGYTRPLKLGTTPAALEPPPPLPLVPNVIELKAGKARLAPSVRLDLGGIAKGWMADRLSERLGRRVLVNLGGDLLARGVDWPVGIASGTYLLRDLGAATSSVRKRRWGEGLHHLIDPRTGRPAQTGLEEVSVVTSTALEAEVVAKTALLLGPQNAPVYCAAHAHAWWLQ